MYERATDMYSQKGATYLAFKIKEFWMRQGYSGIDTWIDPLIGHHIQSRDLWVPRSNLGPDGLPPGKRVSLAA